MLGSDGSGQLVYYDCQGGSGAPPAGAHYDIQMSSGASTFAVATNGAFKYNYDIDKFDLFPSIPSRIIRVFSARS